MRRYVSSNKRQASHVQTLTCWLGRFTSQFTAITLSCILSTAVRMNGLSIDCDRPRSSWSDSTRSVLAYGCKTSKVYKLVVVSHPHRHKVIFSNNKDFGVWQLHALSSLYALGHTITPSQAVVSLCISPASVYNTLHPNMSSSLAPSPLFLLHFLQHVELFHLEQIKAV